MAKTSAERGDGTRRATTRAMKRARGDDDGRNALRRAVGSGARDRATAIAHRKFSCGETLFRRYYDAQGVTRDAVDAAALREALATPLPATYRVHGAREGDAAKRALVKALEALRDGGDVEETHGVYEAANPTGTHRRGRPVVPEHVGDVFAFGTSRGLGSRQEVVSTLPVRALGATSGARCLDVCAAPGQKTMQLLECARYGASGGEGVVHANDAHPGRVGTLLDAIDRHARAGCERAGLFVTRSFGQDLHFPLFVSGGDLKRALKNICGMDDDEKRRAALLAIGGYTHVLADVPCSGDGTIRKDADALVRWHPGIGNALHSTQLAVARRCAQLLKPGGSMVYSTCTFNPIEDEAVVQTLLMDQDLSLELEELDLPLKGRPGMYSWKVGEHINASSEDEDVSIQWFASFDDAVRKSSSEFVKTMWPLDAPAHAEALRLELCARFLPHDDNTGGFFVAKLKRKNDERTRRAFAALVESELVARCDASAAAGKPPPKPLTEDKDAALDRLVPAHRVSKSLAKILRERYCGAKAFCSIDPSRRRIYVGSVTASAILDRTCSESVRLARGGVALFEPSDGDFWDDNAVTTWEDQTEDLNLTIDGVDALRSLLDEKLPSHWLTCLPTELDALLTMSGSAISLDELSEQTRKRAVRIAPGRVILCLRKKSGEVVFAMPGVCDGLTLQFSAKSEDVAKLAASLRVVAKLRK
jgi:tRNA (cytosine34-C5)-methyltransferase